mmetsp:Transcript_33198/g.63662  ORF Transcript_33198/g.63662 Transcript_33198/m.63662 type:complete len:223 (-) Transcript_33198:121-789(-)
MLHIYLVPVLTRANGRQPSQHAKWRMVLQRIPRHMRDKNRVMGRRRQGLILQPSKAFQLTPNGPQIKHNTRQHLGFWVGCCDPAHKVLPPNSQRLPPAIRRGHHIAGTIYVAAGIEPVANKLRQLGKIAKAHLFRDGIIEDQTVVLIAHAGLFLPSLRAADQPNIGHRWHAKPVFGQSQKPTRGRICHIGDQTGDNVMPMPGPDELRQQLWNTRRNFGHLFR